LGNWNDSGAGQALARIALRDPNDPRLQTAVMSSATNHVGEMLAVVFSGGATSAPPSELTARLIGLATALNDQTALARALDGLASLSDAALSEQKFGAFASFLDALDRRKISSEQFSSGANPALRNSLTRLEPLFATARMSATNGANGEAERIAAIRLLGRQGGQRRADAEQLGGLLGPRNSSRIQRAALATLARQTDVSAADVLLAGWNSDSPALRNEVLDTLLSRPAWTQSLLTAIEHGQVPVGQIGAAHQQKLFKSSNSSMREQATKLFAASTSSRGEILKNYAGVPQLRGDVANGFALFKQNCASCHRLRGEGAQVGPDLGSVADKSTATLLVAILDPNQAVEWRYVNYTAMLKDDREVSGIMAEETPNSITLRGPDGREETILRTDIEDLRSSGLSLMPEGLETALKPQDMADLLAALQGK
jgi:putative heme-binding domain-containing protein